MKSVALPAESTARSVAKAQYCPLRVISFCPRVDGHEELEPYIRLILHDPNETPHGPAEIADIFTHRLSIHKLSGMAAFILKGRSFPTVRPKDVATPDI